MKDWYFINDNNFITEEYVNRLLEDYDVLIPDVSNKDSSLEYNLEEVIPQEYLSAYLTCKKYNLSVFNNMFIAKPEIEDEFFRWIDSLTGISESDFGQLLYTWLLSNQYKVKQLTIMEMDPETSEDAAKKVELVHQYLKYIVDPVLNNYKSSTMCSKNLYVNLDEKSDGSFITEDKKIPIWVCWFQGLDNAPELVKVCIESIRNNLPDRITEIKLLDFNNLFEYVTLPEHIIAKYNEGKIGPAHLSDIIRSYLLYNYGGMWIDATYFVANSISEKFFNEQEFWTHRMAKPMWRADIVQGNFSCNLLYSKRPGNLYFKFMLDSLYYFWETQDSVIDYFFFDHIMAFGFDEIPTFHNMISSVDYSNPNMFELKANQNRRFNKEKWEKITSNTTFFKLTYRDEHQKETLVGDETFWGHVSTF